MRGAPVLGNTAGSLVAVLDALLVNGWGALTATSGVIADGIATFNFAETDTFNADEVVLIAGASPPELNGEARVLAKGINTISIATTAEDGPITGPATVKYAPAGWAIALSDGNRRAYRHTDPSGPAWYYWVDDSASNYARWRIFESMEDLDTGITPCPTEAQMAGGGYMIKWTSGAPASTFYEAAADPLAVLLGARNGGFTNLAVRVRGFGLPVNVYGSGDANPWSAFISCGYSTSGGYGYGSLLDSSESYTAGNVGGQVYCVRNPAGTAYSATVNVRAVSGGYNVTSGNYGTWGALSAGGTVLLSPLLLTGHMSVVPGAYFVPQSGAYSHFNQSDILAGVGALAGRRLLAIRAGGRGNLDANGVAFIDMTGPWR